MLGKSEYKNKVYKGALNYINDSDENNDAVEKIIEIVKNNKKTTIIAIGAITNVALAIKKDSSIIKKRWEVYSKKYDYANGINYEDIMKCLEEIIKVIELISI